jgi:hypothetical protein
MAIDPITQQVIVGLITSSVTTLASRLAHRSKRYVDDEERLRVISRKKEGFQESLQKAVAAAARHLEFRDKKQEDKVRLFLVSPEGDAIARQVLASLLAGNKTSGREQLLRSELSSSLALYLREDKEGVGDLADKVFNMFREVCRSAIDASIKQALVSAQDISKAAHDGMVLDQLAVISKNVKLLSSAAKPELDTIIAFESKYREQIGNRHAYIIPPHFDSSRRVPIDDIYVTPLFVAIRKGKDREGIRVNASDFLSVSYRSVILGNPGCGKSTFSAKLCHDLSTRYSERLLGGKQATAILVVLREYGAEKKLRRCSILQFIESTANSRYQVEPPRHAFEYLLLNGRLVVIFDGLDELLDTTYRQEISGDVEAFCHLYPSVPVLVTSREVGYEQAPLDEKKFDLFRLAPFDDEQVEEYSRKWFSVDPELTSEQQKKKAEAFYEESQVASDLRSNPLMLGLMCNIYRGENYIPKNRPDVYEKCAVMLFERWDKMRSILVPLPFEAHISPTIKYLAHWIYSNESLQGGVTEKILVAKAADYLCTWRFEERERAEKAAREFIEFSTGRAWVFTDTGTTKEGERLFQFTHRTFLEYFTASYLVRTHPTAIVLARVLVPRIKKREWDVVSQLAFQLQSKGFEGAGEKLLEFVLEASEKGKIAVHYQKQSSMFRIENLGLLCKPTLAGEPRFGSGRHPFLSFSPTSPASTQR